MQCHRKESFVCCAPGCATRLCKKCCDSYPKEDVTMLDPPNQVDSSMDDSNSNDSDGDSFVISEIDSDEEDDDISLASSNSDQTPVSFDQIQQPDEFDDCEHDDGIQKQLDLLRFGSYDTEQDAVVDDFDILPFYTTDAGDQPVSVEQNPYMDTVLSSGHVILNHAATCTRRYGRKLNAVQRDKFFIQSLASTTPGQATSLATPEAGLFPRIFWAAASTDSQSILGALPIFAMGADSRFYGFDQAHTLTRQRISASGSISSTDKHYWRHRWDVSACIALSNADSRHVMNKGFTIDTKSSSGLTVDIQDDSNLNESVDSSYLVMALSESQKYIKYDIFGTITCNHAKTPGVATVHNWIRSKSWYPKIKGFHKMDQRDLDEIDRAMEEASCPVKIAPMAGVQSRIFEATNEKTI
jgi:hypothetical protein